MDGENVFKDYDFIFLNLTVYNKYDFRFAVFNLNQIVNRTCIHDTTTVNSTSRKQKISFSLLLSEKRKSNESMDHILRDTYPFSLNNL